MKILKYCILISGQLFAHMVHGQQEPLLPLSNDYSLHVLSAQPFLLKDASVTGVDFLEATLDVASDAAKISFAPGLSNTEKYIDFWSETRFELEKKENGIGAGISFKYNPLNARSRNGLSLWNEIRKELKSRLDAKGTQSARNKRIIALNKRIDLILRGPEDASCTNKSIAENQSKINAVLSKYKMKEEKEPIGTLSTLEFEEVRCAFSHILDAMASLNKMNAKEYQSADGEEVEKQLGKFKNEITPLVENGYWVANEDSVQITDLTLLITERDSLEAKNTIEDNNYAQLLFPAYKARLQSSLLPVIGLSYKGIFTGVFSGRERNDDGQKDHRMLGRYIALEVKKSLGNKQSIDLSLSREFQRSSATAGDSSAHYDGRSITWTYRIKVLNSNYRGTKAFKESLFIPAVNLGLSYEYRKCRQNSLNCNEGITKQESFTPFLDVSINKTSQFRLSFPIGEARKLTEDAETKEVAAKIEASVKVQLGAQK